MSRCMGAHIPAPRGFRHCRHQISMGADECDGPGIRGGLTYGIVPEHALFVSLNFT